MNCHPERSKRVLARLRSRGTCSCLLFCHPERSFLRSKKRSRKPALSEGRISVPSRMGTPTLLTASLLLTPFSACFAQPPEKQPSHTFHDRSTRISFDYPANWTFAEHDREISTFQLDARTAPRAARLRAVVAMPENPYPASTFSGAYLYFSVTPQSSAAACARQAVPPRITTAEATHRAAEARAHSDPDQAGKPPAIALTAKPDKLQIAGIAFTHGRDEQRDVCLTQHDDVYTTFRAGSCLRFDLAINNFCGGEVSGVRDITPRQLDDVRARLTAILSTMRFGPK